MKQISIISKSARQTQALAKNLWHNHKSPKIFCLFGELGSGKTTFSQGLAKACGATKSQVKSPTYVFCHQYRTEHGLIYHYDLYRINSVEDLRGIGLEEIITKIQSDGTCASPVSPGQSLIIIEWAEKLGPYLPQKRIEVHFKIADNNERKIMVKIV